jgi:hypothetical protein
VDPLIVDTDDTGADDGGADADDTLAKVDGGANGGGGENTDKDDGIDNSGATRKKKATFSLGLVVVIVVILLFGFLALAYFCFCMNRKVQAGGEAGGQPTATGYKTGLATPCNGLPIATVNGGGPNQDHVASVLYAEVDEPQVSVAAVGGARPPAGRSPTSATVFGGAAGGGGGEGRGGEHRGVTLATYAEITSAAASGDATPVGQAGPLFADNSRGCDPMFVHPCSVFGALCSTRASVRPFVPPFVYYFFFCFFAQFSS